MATVAATVPDVAMTEPIHDNLHAKDLLPGEHVVDAGYTSAELLLAARARGVTLLGPLLADTSPQARTGGYTTAAFTIDWDNQQVRCPQGATRACPAKTTCTTATQSGRHLSLRPRRVHEAVEQARAEQSTDRWHNDYVKYTPGAPAHAWTEPEPHTCNGSSREQHEPESANKV